MHYQMQHMQPKFVGAAIQRKICTNKACQQHAQVPVAAAPANCNQLNLVVSKVIINQQCLLQPINLEAMRLCSWFDRFDRTVVLLTCLQQCPGGCTNHMYAFRIKQRALANLQEMLRVATRTDHLWHVKNERRV